MTHLERQDVWVGEVALERLFDVQQPPSDSDTRRGERRVGGPAGVGGAAIQAHVLIALMPRGDAEVVGGAGVRHQKQPVGELQV